jgi:uncharacterized membrane protein
MSKGRLEAFSDGVLAIIITIMVLELKAPHASDWHALEGSHHPFLSYVLSFIYVGIYWNNHHHLFQIVKHVSGGVLWANLHLLFWLSLIPFVTSWMGETQLSSFPVAAYGVVLLMAGVAYFILARVLVGLHGRESHLALALGRDRKGLLSVVIYAIAIGLAFVSTYIAAGLYLLVGLIWLIPDRRIEGLLRHPEA